MGSYTTRGTVTPQLGDSAPQCGKYGNHVSNFTGLAVTKVDALQNANSGGVCFCMINSAGARTLIEKVPSHGTQGANDFFHFTALTRAIQLPMLMPS